MDTDSIIREIKNSMTGDPKKDGPFLKSQSEKYKDDENSAEINRELAKLLYQCSYDDMHKTIDNFLASENPKVNEKLKEVRKRFANLNFCLNLLNFLKYLTYQMYILRHQQKFYLLL